MRGRNECVGIENFDFLGRRQATKVAKSPISNLPLIPSPTPTQHRRSKPHSILPGTPQRSNRRWRRRRMPCLARSAWPGRRCPISVPAAIGCTLRPTRQRVKCRRVSCVARAGKKTRTRRRKDTKVTDVPSSPHPLIFSSPTQPRPPGIADHPHTARRVGTDQPLLAQAVARPLRSVAPARRDAVGGQRYDYIESEEVDYTNDSLHTTCGSGGRSSNCTPAACAPRLWRT